MATVPVPRSYAQIVGDQIDALLSKLGLPSIRVGSPVLSIIEAAAQSDLRSSQDIFNLLNASSLDRATGQALDRIGADENLPRIGESPSSGVVTITDGTFTKVETTIFQGLPAPIIGSAVVYVSSALSFPASGQIYIGRGTLNYEGPLNYTSVTNNSNYWTINLAGGSNTKKYHNLGESVILAQGGNRVIPSGTLVQTAQSNAATSVQFKTLFDSTLPDGETEIDSISVVCQTPGVIGNVVSGAISQFVSAPFTGASVTNGLPYTNGLATEDDNTYRERIRNERQSRSKGTALAIETNVVGITAPDENKTVISASVVTRAGYPTTLYIDDGTGYEESSIGIAYETLVDEALGGEQYFQLVSGRPVTKAYALTTLVAPFVLQAGMTLAFLVGGQLSQHLFSASEFRSITSASAFEFEAAINGDPTLLFGARTVNNGTQVACFARADTNEDIQNVSPATGFTDANPVLGFSSGRSDSLRLYKNDRLLSKDGQLATVTSNPQGAWASNLASGETLSITVDGILIPGSLSTITDADFVNAGTGYTHVSTTNSIDSWAQVFNFKIPGITAEVVGGTITITSNRGRSSTASVAIGACTLVSKGVFTIETSIGKNFDYQLDRNLGQIRLQDSLILAVDDKLTAGSLATRGFLESSDISTITISNVTTSVSGQNGAELWFVVDGDAQIVKTGIGPGTSLTWSLIATNAWGKRVRIAATTAVFTNAVLGNWIIVNDSAVNQLNQGAWRIARLDPSGLWVEIERPTSWNTPATYALTSGGVIVVSTDAQVQRVFIPQSSNYTATSLAAAIVLRGATASTYRTTKVRVRTNRFAIGGDIALVAANSEGLKLTLPVASATVNQTSHLAAIEAGNPETGTPAFEVETVSSISSTTSITMTSLGQITSGKLMVALKDFDDGTGGKIGNKGFYTPIAVISGSTLTLRRGVVENWFPGDRLYAASHYAMTAVDQMTVLLDGDTTSHRFVMPMYRRGTPSSGTYGSTVTLHDKDNGNVSLAETFGTTMDWTDFAVFMAGRTKSSQSLGVDTNQTVLWRYNRLGPDGNDARIQYVYPTAPGAPLAVSANPYLDQYVDIGVTLPSGAARTGILDSNTTKLGYAVTSGPSSGLYTYVYTFNLPISSASREVRLDYNSKTSGWVVTNVVTGKTSLASGTISAVVGGAPGGASGTIILTGVTGNFLAGEQLSVTGAGGTAVANATNTQYGVAKLILTLPTGITNHGFSVGNQLYMNYNATGTGAGFTIGIHTVLETPSGTQINYVEGTTAISSTLNVGTVSYDTSPVGLGASTALVGDIFNLSAASSLPSNFNQSIKTQTLSDSYLSGQSPTVGTVTATLTWAAINSTSNLTIFPLNAGSCTIIAIAAAVNALANSPVTAVAVGTGSDSSGSILYATYEASPNGLGGTDPWYYLSDGINHVWTTNTPGTPATDFIFTFKDPVTASLATNSDFANEDVRLVPITADNVSNYLNTSGPGGLFASGEIVVANRGGRPQIATLTVGSSGSVQVQGGTANAITSAVLGAAVAVGSQYSVVNVAYSDTQGMVAGHWMSVQNSVAVPKARIDANTNLSSLDVLGNVIFNNTGTKAWDWSGTTSGPIAGMTWQIEKHGNFVAFAYSSGGSPTLTGVQEGDWVHISDKITNPGNIVNIRNQGLFRIVRIDTVNNIFWIVNTNVFEEVNQADLAFLTYDSIIPGDQLIINTSLWGLNNLGTWTVSAIDLTTYNIGNTNNRWKFALSVATRTPQAVSSVGALGTSAGLVQIVEAAPSTLYKRIQSINVNASNSLLADVKFDTQAGYSKISTSAGSILTSLDKLNFSEVLATGIDGYQHSIGLIAEANKVGYGDESDTSTYPGVIAAGAQVNIQGPLVRRVQVSLSLRVRTGINTTDIEDQVRSAVASLVNGTGVGDPVAISDIISVAQAVNGVLSVTVISPTFGVGNDLISVQPYEKPLILSLDDDVLISFVGE